MNKTAQKLTALFMDVATMPYTFSNLVFDFENTHEKALKKNHITLGVIYLAPAIIGAVTTPAVGLALYSVLHAGFVGGTIGIEIAERGAAKDLYPRMTALKALAPKV